jgi:L-rhamnose isomerase
MNSSNQKKGAFSKVGSNPQVDWIIVMTISIIATLVLVAWSVFVYQGTKGIDGFTQDSGDISGGLDSTRLSRVIGIFDEKARQREELKRGYPGATDPSI